MKLIISELPLIPEIANVPIQKNLLPPWTMSQSSDDPTIDDELAANLASLDLNLPIYSHDIALKAITSFYRFISRMHPEEVASIDFPPPTGWPQIIPNIYDANTPAAVIESLRYIPNLGEAPCILEETYPFDFLYRVALSALVSVDVSTKKEAEKSPKEDEVEAANADTKSHGSAFEPNGDLPNHFMRLTCSGNLWGYNILLDTIRGVIIWCDVSGIGFRPRDILPGSDVISPEEDSDIDHIVSLTWVLTWCEKVYFLMAVNP